MSRPQRALRAAGVPACAPIALADSGDGTAALTIAASAPGAQGKGREPHTPRTVPASPFALPDRPASVNGTVVPTNPVPEPHYRHSSTDYQYFQNGTTAPHHYGAHKREAVVADLGGNVQEMSVPHWHSAPEVTARVRVSEIALQNGILIEGITDGVADLPRERQLGLLGDRGVHGDPDVGAMEVRKLHEVTLVAELPVGVPDGGDYAMIDPDLAIEPWGCWPRLNHPASCPGVVPGAGCPQGPGGAAWVP